MDGVLTDTASTYFPFMRKYLHEHSIDITDEDVSLLVGFAFKEKTEFINKKYGLKIDYKDFVEKVSKKAREEFPKVLKPSDGVIDLIQDLKSNNIKIGLATSNAPQNMEVILNTIGLWSEFEVIVDGYMVKEHKPNPEVYLKTINLLGLKPRECIAVEDTVIGVQAAKNAGLKAIAFPSKFTQKHDFSQADLIIKSLTELNYKKLNDLIK